ncbi:DUF1328 domain-containing protein [Halobacterium zhouii]|uniref:DUF1328 domain-containing protein n=1 Tax=Halobacterium zhouii TaxID=2902624 RepID=UPI001E595D60|nr:DUF1328 domain-containing protein [Halobacterium zhouii]
MIPSLAPTRSGAAFVLSSLTPLQVFSGDFLYYAIVFFVLAILAALLGARGIAGMSMEIARILVLIFLVLAVISLLL